MASRVDTLPREGQVLMRETMARLDALYDAQAGLLRAEGPYMRGAHNVRASAHYALGLLIRGGPEDAQRAEGVLGAVMDTQFDDPAEVYHGTFKRAPQEPYPPRGTLPWRDITLLNRYSLDVFFERVGSAFYRRVQADEALAPHARALELQLRRAVLDEFPVAWLSYDPNWREFILCAFALILLNFEDQLPPPLVWRMEQSAALALRGAMDRSRSGFTPLNTNIEIMHVFILDAFGARLKDDAAQAYALQYAEDFAKRYFAHHAIHEFNSPTYCGVDLTAIGYWRAFAQNTRIRALGQEIEAGLWEDIAAFYNPAMQNLCGPFSRNYDMDMAVHTSMHALMYMGLGEDAFPHHPYNQESDHNPLLVLCGVQIPEEVKPRLLTPQGERTVTRQFQELSERGNPRDNMSLCTATAWITDELMVGALSGSRNVSGQLHPAVVYWRDAKGGVSSMRLRRSDTDGEIGFFHTVVFDGKCTRNRIEMDIDCQARRDIVVFFEFESGDLENAAIEAGQWTVSNLSVAVDGDFPAEHTVTREGNHLQIAYLARLDVPQTQKMHFDLTFARKEGL